MILVSPVERSCWADVEGRNLLVAFTILEGSIREDNVSIANVDPFWDLVSVEEVPWLSLRLRRMYCSIAFASRSRTRVANAVKVAVELELETGGIAFWERGGEEDAETDD